MELNKLIEGERETDKNVCIEEILNKCRIYVTCEPCIMCAHALNLVGN